MGPGGADETVLVPHDDRHAGLLDSLARELLALGYAVHRGTPQKAASGGMSDRVSIIVATSRVPVDAEMMAAFPVLHTIVIPTTGLESVALETATALGIAVANGATTENVVSLAEATLLLVLALLYRLPAVVARWSGNWPSVAATTLHGKTVGLIGYGGVAQAMVPRLQAFGAKPLVYSARSGHVAEQVGFVDLRRLLEQSDVVCVVGALNDRTWHLVDAAALRSMKPGALLVNTARGALVDEAALCEALASGHIAGAALDTFETEPLPEASPLRALNNVILTPHCVGHTRDLLGSFLPALLRNIGNATSGELPFLCRNPQVRDHWRRLGAITPYPMNEAAVSTP